MKKVDSPHSYSLAQLSSRKDKICWSNTSEMDREQQRNLSRVMAKMISLPFELNKKCNFLLQGENSTIHIRFLQFVHVDVNVGRYWMLLAGSVLGVSRVARFFVSPNSGNSTFQLAYYSAQNTFYRAHLDGGYHVRDWNVCPMIVAGISWPSNTLTMKVKLSETSRSLCFSSLASSFPSSDSHVLHHIVSKDHDNGRKILKI